jgi:L-seryl-tRNA(Ser) seleniumtransferase
MVAEDRRRRVPAVDAVVAEAPLAALHGAVPHTLLVEVARAVLAEERERLSSDGGEEGPRDAAALAAVVAERATRELTPTLHPVVNATGVILHTNLGRAPLSAAAVAAVAEIAAGYTNLEYDEVSGRRGSRHAHAERLLCLATGAEAACVVNNCAAGLVLVLAAVARGREVLVSRGQAVEIGGGFRIPDVMRQSGARLVDVGTTNRTRAGDYAAAITARTAALLRVHRSNFRLQGFVEDTSLGEMAALAHERGLHVLDDLGGGCLLDVRPYGLAGEPTVGESLAAGADLVLFSGDKLLGGPQAGLVVGRAGLVETVRRHSLMRALRVDKMTLAALQATLLHYVQGEALTAIPVWRMIAATPEELWARAERVAQRVRREIGAEQVAIGVVAGLSAVGGGSLPGQTLRDGRGGHRAVGARCGGMGAATRGGVAGAPAVGGGACRGRQRAVRPTHRAKR